MDYNARYYSARLGRFVSPDTIVPEPGSSGGFNRYRYTRNNPLKYTDPSGHCPNCDDSDNHTMLYVREETRASWTSSSLTSSLPPAEPLVEVEEGTASLEATVSGNIPGLEGAVDFGLAHTDTQGNWAFGTITGGGGGTTGVFGLNAGPSLSFTNGDNLSVLPGETVYAGGEVSGGIVTGAADGFKLPNDIEGVKLNLGFGPEIKKLPLLPYSADGGADHTVDGAILSIKPTSDGFDVCWFCRMTTFFGDE